MLRAQGLLVTLVAFITVIGLIPICNGICVQRARGDGDQEADCSEASLDVACHDAPLLMEVASNSFR